MPDRPTQTELLTAVRRFLDEELMPELEGVRRFHARVASNALAIVARELELEGPSLARRHAQLAALLSEDAEAPTDREALSRAVAALETRLGERIRAGAADAPPFRDRVLACLRESVRERLAINNPGYR